MSKVDLLAKYAEPLPVLDYGHVRLVDVMGDDYDIESAARLSYQQGTRKRSETRGLLRYLMRHRHTSPFEQAVIKLDMKMPIFIARQLVRHRTQSINELSGRYSELPEEYYVPEADQICYQDKKNKQGRAEPFEANLAAGYIHGFREESKAAFRNYQAKCKAGMARETARINLPLSTYTQWCTTMNVHNLLHMLSLRLDPHAQYEVRVYAEAIWKIVEDWLPITAAAFRDYRLDSHTFSGPEMRVLKTIMFRLIDTHVLGDNANIREMMLSLLSGESVSGRERDEFFLALEMKP